jgi:uncharacterized paraquat-inducible protein A
MPPAIRVRCPGCGVRLKAPFHLRGQTHPCPQCGVSLTVRLRAPDDAGPLLLRGDGPATIRRTVFERI